jgi:hypothetical protein
MGRHRGKFREEKSSQISGRLLKIPAPEKSLLALGSQAHFHGGNRTGQRGQQGDGGFDPVAGAQQPFAPVYQQEQRD